MNERLDRIDRTMEAMAARQQYHDEALERLSASLQRLESKVEELADGHRQLLIAQVVMSHNHSELTKKTSILDEKMAQLADAQAQLTESQKHTDERLNALIDIMKNQSPPTM